MIAALFVRRDSTYKTWPGVDCYDEDRNALTWRGGCPGIFHPPCRSWAKLKHFAKPLPGERELALWSVDMVRRFGGVMEHPLHSDVWRSSSFRSFGIRDDFGGVLISVNQADFGHRAFKATALYIVGAPVPALPFVLASSSRTVENMGRAERERTPGAFASLLVNLARQAVAS